MPNILDLSARLSADVRPFVNSMGSSAQASSSTFQSIAQAATMYLGGRGLLGTLNRANEAFMSFEQSLADASAISTLSVKEIGNALLDLDNVFGRVSKASASMYRILSSGFSKLDATQLVEFQKAVGVSAKVIRADLYNTADVMTTIANAYQLNIDEIKKLQDWFYITVREGKAQGQDLARTLGLVINSASEAGVSLNELGAAIAVLSRTQSVSQSMIGLNQMLNAFIKPTLQAQAAARKWGIELNATALQTRGLTSFLTELHEKVGGNVEALEAMFGNIRAGRAILSLTGKQFQNYLNVLNTYNTEEGGGAEAFAKQIDTLQNAYERFQAQQEKTLIQVGEDWEGVRKVIYRTGESMLKAFSDTSAFSRWTIYFAGIGLAVKNIIGVVRNLKNSIDGTTRSVDRLASAFTRASLSSHGMGGGIYSGVRPDTISLRKKIETAVRSVTGSQTPLQAKYDAFIRQANPWGFRSAAGINPKYNPYAFIAQNTLSPFVAEHRARAAQMAEAAIGNYFVKHKDIVDPNTGAVTDWSVKNAQTGFVYKRTWNQLKRNMTNSIFIQNEKAMNAARTDIASAIRVLGGAKGTEAQILQDATDRINAFYSGKRGHRFGTVSNMTSGERLMRMKHISPLSAKFGIGMSNLGKGWSTFTTTLGESMGKAFTAVTAVSMGVSVAEWGYRFGEAVSEQFELSETGLFRRLGGWLAKYWDGWLPNFSGSSLQHMDYKDAEREAFQTQISNTRGQYQQAIKRARTAGMEEGKIAEFELNFMKILTDNDDLESASTQLRDLVNNFVAQIDALNSAIERANKFEKERQEILKQYEGKSIKDIIATQQRASILNRLTDFDKFEKDPDVLRIAKEAVDTLSSGGEWKPSSSDVAKITDGKGGLSQGFVETINHIIKTQVAKGIFDGNISIKQLREMYDKSFYYVPGSGMQQAEMTLGWLKNGKLSDQKSEGGISLDTSVVKNILDAFDANPTDNEEAVKDVLVNLIRPVVASKFTELLDNVNDLVADIGEDILSIEDLPLDVETSESLYAEKAKRSRAIADTLERKYRVALGHALQERELIIDAVRAKILATMPDIPIEEIDNEVQRQMEQYDKTFIANIATAREKVLRASQTATTQEEKADSIRVGKVGDRLTGRLNQIEMLSIRGRISASDESKRKMLAYKKAVDGYNRELKIISKKDSDAYKQTAKMRDEALKNMYREQINLINIRSVAREQLMGALGNVVSGNLKNGRLTNYGIQHAMNLLSRLSPRFQFDVGGASLQDVMRNARARYSGSTPDVSRAMQQQRRLSEIMDAYITAKQYEDAGIGKNVQTIVTIMGKRQPLYLN